MNITRLIMYSEIKTAYVLFSQQIEDLVLLSAEQFMKSSCTLAIYTKESKLNHQTKKMHGNIQMIMQWK